MADYEDLFSWHPGEAPAKEEEKIPRRMDDYQEISQQEPVITTRMEPKPENQNPPTPAPESREEPQKPPQRKQKPQEPPQEEVRMDPPMQATFDNVIVNDEAVKISDKSDILYHVKKTNRGDFMKFLPILITALGFMGIPVLSCQWLWCLSYLTFWTSHSKRTLAHHLVNILFMCIGMVFFIIIVVLVALLLGGSGTLGTLIAILLILIGKIINR